MRSTLDLQTILLIIILLSNQGLYYIRQKVISNILFIYFFIFFISLYSPKLFLYRLSKKSWPILCSKFLTIKWVKTSWTHSTLYRKTILLSKHVTLCKEGICENSFIFLRFFFSIHSCSQNLLFIRARRGNIGTGSITGFLNHENNQITV